MTDESSTVSGEEFTTPKPQPKGKPKLFDCPACGGSIRLNAAGHSVRAACAHCGSLVDTSNENLRLVDRAHEKLRPSLLQLGTFGTLFGKRWQVIGWMEKRDRASGVTWEEYLLFSPYHGFRFLVQADGHWSLLQVIKEKLSVPLGNAYVEYDGRHYAVFQEGTTEVTYVAGEFYWEVQRGDATNDRDFVAPPFLVSIERSHGEINVAHGEYIDPNTVASTFGLGARLPTRIGVAPNQPSPYAAAWRAIKNPAASFIFIATLIQVGAVAISDNETLVKQRVVTYNTDPEKTLVVPGLHFSDQFADVVVETDGRLDNQWMEVDFQLVNDRTDQSYTFRNAMDFYSGVSAGEYWSEGSRNTDTVLSMVPGGDYTLVAELDGGPPAPSGDWVWYLQVRRDVALWMNFWTVLALGLVVPLYLGIRHHGFEQKRWSQSDYAPMMYRTE